MCYGAGTPTPITHTDKKDKDLKMAANIPKHVTLLFLKEARQTSPSLQGWREPLKPGNSRCKG